MSSASTEGMKKKKKHYIQTEFEFVEMNSKRGVFDQ